MELQIIRDSEGQIVATAEVVQPSLGVSAAEPQLTEGQRVEVDRVSANDLGDLQNFYTRGSKEE